MKTARKKIVLSLLSLALIFIMVPLVILPDGADLFREQKCITCHRFRGQGGLAGPDLSDVVKRRSTLWLFRQIRNSRSHNPDSRMPSFEHLGYTEIYALISYLKS